MIATFLVEFYKFWHGFLHFKGAGFLLGVFARSVQGLQSYSLSLPQRHSLTLDFRDISAIYWLNCLLQDPFEEAGLLAAILDHTTEETVIWDCGANCGVLSYLLARRSNAKEIVFFEPNPSMFALAKAATAPFKNVRGFEIALSDKPGRASLIIPIGGSTTATMEATRTKRSGDAISIRCETGDNLVRSKTLEVPQVIKIDTEGHELAVIRGLQHVITYHSPEIFFEHVSLSDEEVVGIVPPGYEIYTVGDQDGSLSKGFDRSKGHNSALIPESNIRRRG